MAEYIERNEFLELQIKRCSNFPPLTGTCAMDNVTLESEIMKFPVADVEPVTHAEWEYDGADRRCSNCGAIVEEDEWFNHNWYYCYHCGAKMGGE